MFLRNEPFWTHTPHVGVQWLQAYGRSACYKHASLSEVHVPKTNTMYHNRTI